MGGGRGKITKNSHYKELVKVFKIMSNDRHSNRCNSQSKSEYSMVSPNDFTLLP